jgi:hypothetical protein
MSIIDTLPEVATFEGGTDKASTSAIYEGDGTSLSARIRKARRAGNPAYKRNLLEAAHLYERTLAGSKRAALDFQEAMSTSDFSNLFGDIIDRQILAKYVSQPVQWDMLAKRGRVRDFRTVNRFTLDGGEAVLAQVKQLSEYPAAKLADGKYAYAVGKYGRRMPLSWETLVNDDLDAFRDIPDRLGNAARRTEERFATALYTSATGFNTTFFTTGNKNIINPTTLGSGAITNPPLGISGLQLAYQILGQQLDADGAPIYVDGVTLVVPPALTVVANNIINATEIWTAAGSSGLASDAGRQDQLRVANWMANKVKVQTNPWLPILSPTNGNTSWYLFSDPTAGRPAMEVGFLIGHEQPELFQKSPNSSRVGGGAAAAEDGDFDSDSIEWKLRHVLGGTLMDPKAAVASNGSGA